MINKTTMNKLLFRPPALQVVVVVLTPLLLMGSLCRQPEDPVTTAVRQATPFQLSQAAPPLLQEMAAVPHPLGSRRQQVIGDRLLALMGKAGLQVQEQAFTATVPNPRLHRQPDAPAPLTLEKAGRNIIALTGDLQQGCVYLLGSHYDTKAMEFPYHGANDSGSSSVTLVEIMQWLHRTRPESTCAVAGVWFDGEEALLPDWNDGLRHPARIEDHTYGSRHMVAGLIPCPAAGQAPHCLTIAGQPLQVRVLILLDLIGSPKILLNRDTHSSPALMEKALLLSKALGVKAPPFGRAVPVEDDHIPFLKHGIPAINLIDMHNLDTWHRPGDDTGTVSFQSMERAGRLALALLILLNSPP